MADSPDTLARHRRLADELFPPSPEPAPARADEQGPVLSSSGVDVRNSDRESYYVSDSEVEQTASPSRAPASERRKAKARVSHLTTSLDSDEELERRAELDVGGLRIE